jgi:hypothetical protein
MTIKIEPTQNNSDHEKSADTVFSDVVYISGQSPEYTIAVW